MTNKINLQFIDGKKLHIEEMRLKNKNNTLVLMLVVNSENVQYQINCRTVSSLELKRISFPAVIHGLSVIDNRENGWQSDVRYTFYDYEESSINFYCEDFDIIRIE